MSTLYFVLLIVGILLFGIVVGIISYIFSSMQNRNIPTDFCSRDSVFSKFDHHEISIDKVCKKFKLLDM